MATSGELPDRLEREAALTQAVQPVLERYRLNDLGVADALYAAAEPVIQDATRTAATLLVLLWMQEESGSMTPVGLAAPLVLAGSIQSAEVQTRTLANNVRDASIQAYRDGRELDAAARAYAIGVTEITTAISLGQAVAAAAYVGPVSRKAYWRTERDKRVCEICRDLDGKSAEVYEKQFPFGPPAHPICRCGIEWR